MNPREECNMFDDQTRNLNQNPIFKSDQKVRCGKGQTLSSLFPQTKH